MSRLIDREEMLVYNGFKYQFTLYWGKDARNGGLFALPPSMVGIIKWIDSEKKEYKHIHIDTDTGRTDIFWMYERKGFFGRKIWEMKVTEDINTIPLEKLLSYIPDSAK